MAQPLFTVVIPTHKRPDKLKAVISSLRKQTLDRSLFAIVVVNDGGDPVTAEWLNGQKDIDVVNTDGIGPAAARNRGVEKACGKIIAFTDDDALPSDTWLEKARNYTERNSSVLVFEGCVIAKGVAIPLSHYVENNGETNGYLTCNLFVDREFFARMGGFNELFRFPMNEDHEFALRVLQKTNIEFIPDLIVYHPVYKLVFRETFYNARSFVMKRTFSDKLLYELQPVGYAKVKAAATYRQTALRAAFFYVLDELRNTRGLIANPFRALLWFAVLAKRQYHFFIVWIIGRYS